MDFLDSVPAATAPTAMRPITNPKMGLSEKFTRLGGVTTGLITSLVAPHVFCLGPILIGAVGSGIQAPQATTLSYAAGAVMVLGATIGATYGLQRSTAACCLVAETRTTRLKKAGLMALSGLALGAVVNTTLGRGLSDPALSAQAIQIAFYEGRSVWDVLVQICTTGKPTP